MVIIQTVLLAIALSADAFVVSASVAAMEELKLKNSLILASAFALVQGGLFALGFFVGDIGAKFAQEIFQWVGLVLLCALGLKAIKDGLLHSNCHKTLHFNSIFAILLLSISISIDALVAGIPYPIISSKGLLSFGIVTVVTFILTLLGAVLSNKIKDKCILSIIAGIALIAIGISFVI